MDRRRSINYWLNGAMSLSFCAAITAPLIGFLTVTTPEVLMPEKRRPAPPPPWRFSRHFPGKFDAYFGDRFGFRSKLVQLCNCYRVLGLGLSTCPYVVLGKHGWLFVDSDASIDDHAGKSPFSDEELEAWRRIVEERRDWLAQRGIASLLVVAPNKESIYPEFVPDDRGPAGRTRLDQLLAYLQSRSDAAVLDLRPALLAAKASENGNIYQRRDTHWNDRGAFAASRAICDALRPSSPNLPRAERSQYEAKECSYPPDSAGPDLVGMLGLGSWLTERYAKLEPRGPRRAWLAPLQLRPDQLQLKATRATTYEVADSTLPRLVVFGDSFTWTLAPFLAEHFQRSVFICHQWSLDRALVEEEQPQVVVFEVCERFMRHILKLETTRANKGQAHRRLPQPDGPALGRL
jgi:hypothetical protein